MTTNSKKHPVLQLNDKYFGLYWERVKQEWREEKLELIHGRPNPDLIEQRTKDVVYDIISYRTEIDDVEEKLKELTGIPTFPITMHDSETEPDFIYDYGKLLDQEVERFYDELDDHYRTWIKETLNSSDPRSSFRKLPFELRDMIVEYAIEDVEKDWENIGEGLESFRGPQMSLAHTVVLRRMTWVELCDYDVRAAVRNLVELAQLLYTRWIQLRKVLVAKYEGSEEGEKEWQSIRESGEELYGHAEDERDYF
jgi:hypothetical protein